MHDDTPSAMPVNLDSEESLAGEFEAFSPDGIVGQLDGDQSSAMEQLFGHPSDDTFFNPMRGPAFEATGPHDTGLDKVNFVDAGTGEASTGGAFSHVGKTAPDAVVSEAIRLTNKKAVLFPWERGRMARIFGDQGHL